MSEDRYGKFGGLSEAYANVRPGYPQEIIDHFGSLLSCEEPRVLDLGCGTGISTRQLASAVKEIIGADYDERMLEKARAFPLDNVTYVNSRAEALPFADNELDAVTSFGAFHWFCNPEALAEIRRVILPGGFIYVVNRSDLGIMRSDYLRLLREVTGEKMANVREGYNPSGAIKEVGFNEVSEFYVKTEDRYDIDSLLLLFQSMSHWDLVSEALRPIALKKLEEHFKPYFEEGLFKRELEVIAISGFK